MDSCSLAARLATSPHAPRGRNHAAFLASLVIWLISGCESPTGPRERVRTYEVAEAMVTCNSVGGPSLCLSVRTPPDTAWGVLFGVVDGFTHEAGYRYVLQIAERTLRNPPPDAPGVRYRLVAVVSGTRVSP